LSRLKSALSMVFLAAGAALAISIFLVSASAPSARGEVESPTRAQYASETYTQVGPSQEGDTAHFEAEAPDTTYYDFYNRWLAGEGDLPEVSNSEEASSQSTPSENALPESMPSQGSEPGVRAPEKALAVMEPPTPYSQIVDNATSRRFYSTRDWKNSSNRATRYGEDYRYIRPARGATPAWFKVKIPTAGYYTVYARWPAAKGNNPKARFHISTASGLKKAEVNQRKDGGTWVRLGAYKMNEGNRYSVQLAGRSKAEGRIVADAVMVVAGTQAAPHSGNYSASALGKESPSGGPVVDSEVIERARTHMGTPYVHSPPSPCEAYQSEDCSCFTSLVFSKWVSMPDNPVEQWNYGRSVEKSDLRPGDLVFFKEAGENYPITHVAIYSGRGYIIHASSYWGRVVESPMKYVGGYYGAKRIE
jgi:cell wall-associated NlpC family hydrolase